MAKIDVYLFLSAFVVFGAAVTVEEFASRNRLFSGSIYQKIAPTTSNNIVISPLSTQILLALIQTGAKGKTAEEIQTTVNISNSTSEIGGTIKNVLQQLKSNNNYVFRTANKAYITQNFPVKKEFKQLAQETYQADFENINFSDSVNAANTINTWVENQTENKIKNLVESDALDMNTVAVLVNTLYFEGSWYESFDKALTKKISFDKGHNNVVQVDAMHVYSSLETYKYCENLDSKFLELFFTDTRASMVVVLPNSQINIHDLDSHIDQLLAPQNFVDTYVKIALPKFKIETKINQMEILKKLGIRNAFDSLEADFSALAGNKGDVYISDVVQKSFIDVNEAGVKAGAATYGKFYLTSLPPRPKKTFIVDRPFIFYIKFDGIILFVGRVVDPTQ